MYIWSFKHYFCDS